MVLLLWLYVKSKIGVYERATQVLMGLTLVSYLMDIYNVLMTSSSSETIFLNSSFATSLFVGLATGAFALLMGRYRSLFAEARYLRYTPWSSIMLLAAAAILYYTCLLYTSYNYGGNNMRMTYGMGFNDLMEPAFGFATVNEWVHLAVVTDETGVDGEMNGGRPVMTKMYMNGELKLSTTSHQDASKPYASNDSNVPMVAFGGMSATGNRIGDKGANGSMKHLHIWRAAKTQDEMCIRDRNSSAEDAFDIAAQ